MSLGTRNGGKALALLFAAVLLAPALQAASAADPQATAAVEPADTANETVTPPGETDEPQLYLDVGQLQAAPQDGIIPVKDILTVRDLPRNNHEPCGPSSSCLPVDGPQFVDEHGDEMFGDLRMESNIRIVSPDNAAGASQQSAGGPSTLSDDAADGWSLIVEQDNSVRMDNGSRLLLKNGSTLLARENAAVEIPGLVSDGGDTVTISGDELVQLTVDGEDVLRIQNTDGTANILGANETNAATDGTVGVIIAGGGTGSSPNEATDDFATISGGSGNQAGDGDADTTDAGWATVAGGQDNTASGAYSHAAGHAATAAHDGAYVWSDSDASGLSSTGPDQYLIDAAGGVGVGTDAPASALSVEGDVTPATNASHALGSQDLRWTDLFLDSVIHHNGNLTFVDSTGETTATLTPDGNLTVPTTLEAGRLVGNGSGLTGVQASDLANDSVTSAAVVDGEIVSADLDNASVTAPKIGLSCTDGQVIKQANGSWGCGDDADTDTTYDAGTGLTLTGTTFENDLGTSIESSEITDGTLVAADADSTSLQERIAAVCSSGSSIREIAQDGTVTCETDDDTTYTAGTGLTLTGTEFANALGDSIESGEIADGTILFADLDQNGCADEEVMAWNGTSNAWECASTTSGDITAVTAGSGLDGGGTSGDVSLSVNTSQTQSRVTGACGTDESIDTINQDGTVACEIDDDTTYTGGIGITVTSSDTIENDLGDSIETSEVTDGTLVAADADSTSLQERVTGSCATNQSIDTINQDGTVACETDDDTTYTAGDGLELNSGAFELQQDCSSEQILQFQPPEGDWACADDQDTTYSAGDGLDLSGTTFQLDQSCASDEFLRWGGTSWGCSTETGDIESVSAGTGLNGGGTSGDVSLDVDTSAIQERVTGTCGNGSAIDSVASDGSVTCETDDDTLADLNCSTDQIARYDGTQWVCEDDTMPERPEAGNQIERFDADRDARLDLLGSGPVCYHDSDGDNSTDAGEPLYVDTDAGGCGEGVEVLDLRLTDVANQHEAFTLVRITDGDFGDSLTRYEFADTLDTLAVYDADGDNQFTVGDTLYIDGDGDGSVSAGDYRWTEYQGHAAGTLVASGDSDVNLGLRDEGDVLDGVFSMWDIDADDQLSLGDQLYLDLEDAGSVTIPDIRLIDL